jgi:hypothetical protein
MLVDEITKRMNGDRKKINKSRSTVIELGKIDHFMPLF